MKSNLQEPRTKNQEPPQHVAIIMDGNGRWAKQRGLPRIAGHKRGADTLRTIIKACRSEGIKYLTIYAFSSENWKRPKNETSYLMQLLKEYLQQEIDELHRNNVRMRFIGDLTTLSKDTRTIIDETISLTEHNTSLNVTVALSYGSKEEMVRAVRKMAVALQSGALKPENISEESISHALDTTDLPEPDLLIRTGGEQRLSNFLLWQSAYTELYFTDVLWPDFGEAHFREALQSYAGRERRFGASG